MAHTSKLDLLLEDVEWEIGCLDREFKVRAAIVNEWVSIGVGCTNIHAPLTLSAMTKAQITRATLDSIREKIVYLKKSRPVKTKKKTK